MSDDPGADLAPGALPDRDHRVSAARARAATSSGSTNWAPRRSTGVARSAGSDGPVHARVEAINRLLYGERGFRGNRDHYSDVRNSCLNQVLDLRTGIPITLAVVYMEVARRAGLRTDGINFPGHFLVRAYHDADAADGLVVDPYHERHHPDRAGLPRAARHARRRDGVHARSAVGGAPSGRCWCGCWST